MAEVLVMILAAAPLALALFAVVMTARALEAYLKHKEDDR